jgi:hypothetical protein
MSFYVQDPQLELNHLLSVGFLKQNAFQDMLCTNLFDVTILKGLYFWLVYRIKGILNSQHCLRLFQCLLQHQVKLYFCL